MRGWNGAPLLCGNVASKAEDLVLRYTEGATAVFKFAVAVSNKDKQGKESTYFVDVVAFGKTAENAAASIEKGTRVIVFGDWDPQQWDKDGQTFRRLGIVAEEIGVSLKYAIAEVSKVEREIAPASRASAPVSDADPEQMPF